MAITVETRNDIIGLVVTAYNATPGTTLLNELVAIISDGGTLDDVAIALTSSTTIPTTNVADPDSDDFVSASARWSERYPDLQTPEEFATGWLGELVPEAGAAALAEGISIAVELLSGGLSFANLLVEAQGFLSSTPETHVSFGTSAANFNNKVEAAMYHSVTLALDGSASELQDVLVGVTSDDDTVEAANERSGQFTENDDGAINLTAEIDTVVGTIAGDTVNGIITGGDGTTYDVADSIDLGAGNDVINVLLVGNDSEDDMEDVSNTGNNLVGRGADNVETLNITYRDFAEAEDAVSAEVSSFNGLTSVWVRGSTNIGGRFGGFSFDGSVDHDRVTVSGIDADVVVGVADNTSATDVTFIQDGSEDAITLAVGGGSTGDITLRDSAGEDGFDTVTIVTSGSGSTLTSLDGGSDFEELIITGDQGLNVLTRGNGLQAIPASVQTIDASGSSGGVVLSATASRDLNATGGSGADTLVLFVNGDEINRGMSVTGFETVSIEATDDSEVNLDLIDGASILLIGGGHGGGHLSNLTLNNVAEGQLFVFAPLVVVDDQRVLGTTHSGLTVELAEDRGFNSVAFSFNNRGVDAGLANQWVGGLTLDGIESVSLTAADFNRLRIVDIEGIAIKGDDLESISYSGDSDLVLSGLIDAPNLEEFDGSAATGDIDLLDDRGVRLSIDGATTTIVNGGAINNGGVEESKISTGSGNDRVTNTALTGAGVVQTIDTGAGNDTFILNAVMEGSELAVDLGAGDDVIELGDNASNITNENIIIDGGAGSDMVTITASTGGNVTLANIETILIQNEDEDGADIDHLDAIAFADGDLGSVSITDISGNGLQIDAVDGELDAGDASYLGAGGLVLLGAPDEDDTSDRITASDSGDLIYAGRGADSITLGSGADIVFQDMGDGNDISGATVTTTTDDNNVTTVTALTLEDGFDTVAGFDDREDLLLLFLSPDPMISEGTFDVSYSSNELAENLGLTDNQFDAVPGSLSRNGETFTLDDDGIDTLVLFDADFSDDVYVEAIVLTGFASSNFTVADIVPPESLELEFVVISVETSLVA